MLSKSPAEAVVPVTDLDRAARFYRDYLGLSVERNAMHDELAVHAGDGSIFELKLSPTPRRGETEALVFHVDDIDSEVGQLQHEGLRFEQRASGQQQSVVAQVDEARMAWFRDSEGNLLALREG